MLYLTMLCTSAAAGRRCFGAAERAWGLCRPLCDPIGPSHGCRLRQVCGQRPRCALQELEAEAQKLQVEIPAIGEKTERLTAELAKQEQVRSRVCTNCWQHRYPVFGGMWQHRRLASQSVPQQGVFVSRRT